ncbi:HEAT repeat domain-containing protein, partial [Salmonella sp. SAL04286]|uniref:HEAT repeat domain-containing protein n=1 Tax=Salmonella sp. SAL04286 TaxID=3159864 RepID=UPI00397E61D9
LDIAPDEFRARFRDSPIKRAGRDGLRRNAAVALGNSGDRAAVPALVRALDDDSSLLRLHVAWALGRLGGASARAAPAAHREREEHHAVLAE